MTTASSKDEKSQRVAEAILRIVAQLGVGGVTFARLAKSAGVSRSWLYKYVGKSREELLAFAVVYFGRMFSDLKTPDVQRTKSQWRTDVVEGFERLLTRAETYPAVIRLFFELEGTGGHLGRCLEELNERHADRERLELMRIYGKTAKEARSVSEALSVLRLALAHAWVHGRLGKRCSRAEVLAMFERMFAALLNG